MRSSVMMLSVYAALLFDGLLTPYAAFVPGCCSSRLR